MKQEAHNPRTPSIEWNGFLNMMQSVDAFFPIGAFTLSNGLETYVQQERIQTIADLEEYLESYMEILPYNDPGLMYLAWKSGGNEAELIELDQLCAAMKSAEEIRNGSHKTGIRFLKAEENMHPKKGTCSKEEPSALQLYRKLIKEQKAEGFHPIALGVYALDQGIAIDLALSMYTYSLLSAIVNNAVKLVPFSQMEGQRVLNQCLGAMGNLIEQTMSVTAEQLGVSGCSYDIRCMQHKTLYTRLYMS